MPTHRCELCSAGKTELQLFQVSIRSHAFSVCGECRQLLKDTPNHVEFRSKQAMICASDEAAKPVYNHKVVGHKIWLWPHNHSSPADNIYVCDILDDKSEGFAGRTLFFHLSSPCEYDHPDYKGKLKIGLQGPWHSNSDSLRRATGVDLSKLHATWTIVCLKTSGFDFMGNNQTFDDVLFCDRIEGEKKYYRTNKFSVGKIIAQNIANRLSMNVYCRSESRGGSSSGWVQPLHTSTPEPSLLGKTSTTEHPQDRQCPSCMAMNWKSIPAGLLCDACGTILNHNFHGADSKE